MKTPSLFLVMTIFFIAGLVMSCNAQPKSEYEIYSDDVPGASKYLFFMEKKSANPYTLQQGMDYLTPIDVTALKVGEATIPLFNIILDNDGEEYMVGIVAGNVAGFYSGMGTAIGIVGEVPSIPETVGFRKKTQ